MLKMCGRHVSDLYAAIKHKGMGHLVTDNKQEAVAKGQAWLAGNCAREQFDPFVVSTFEICQQAVTMIGQHLTMVGPQAREYCPLCEACNLARNGDASWIDNCTDMMLLVATTNELMRH